LTREGIAMAHEVNSGSLSAAERKRLRDLAHRCAEAAASARNIQCIDLWRQHNALAGKRPMCLVFPEGSWREILEKEFIPVCASPRAALLEKDLWRRLYIWELGVDNPLEPHWWVEKAISDSGWGLEQKRTGDTDSHNAWGFDPILHGPEDLKKLRMPMVAEDIDESRRRLAWHEEVIGDILPVRLVGRKHVGFHLMAQYTGLRGLEQTFRDFIDEPELVHQAMELLTDMHEGVIDQYEKLGLFESNNDGSYHSSGGVGCYSAEPAVSGKNVLARDMWASAESQELAPVSPAMHRQFALPYERRLLSRFARTGYGCCDPLDRKLDDVLALPGIRRISMSPWANVQRAAPVMGNRAIFSWKPAPMQLTGTFDEDAIRSNLSESIAVCAANNCTLEIILKDTHTCDHQPWRFARWAQICRECIDAAPERKANSS
jgi:hypothetical protein